MDQIQAGVNTGFGLDWMSLVFFLIVTITIVTIIVKANSDIAVALIAVPFLIIGLYSTIVMPSWVLGGIIIAVSLILFAALYAIFLDKK
jgi:hypothetical protein